jgi:hypothetical protein
VSPLQVCDVHLVLLLLLFVLVVLVGDVAPVLFCCLFLTLFHGEVHLYVPHGELDILAVLWRLELFCGLAGVESGETT